MKKDIKDSQLISIFERHKEQEAFTAQKSFNASVNCTKSILENRIALGIPEFALMLGLSPKSVERMVKRGEIQAKRIGRRVIIPTKAIETWLNRKD